MITTTRGGLVLAVLAAATLFSGCAYGPKLGKFNSKDDEYVTIMTTGSRMGVRVKKSDVANGAPAAGDAKSMDRREFEKNQLNGDLPKRIDDPSTQPSGG